METKAVNFYYTAIQALYWAVYCLCYGFAAVFALAQGVSNEWIGVLLAGANIGAVLFQLGIDRLLNAWTKLNLKKVLLVVLLLLIVVASTIYLLPLSPLIKTLVYGLGITLILTLQPFVNALGFEYANAGYYLNFGFSRGFGSLGYALASLGMGQILTVKEPLIIPLIIALATTVLIIMVACLPKNEGNETLVEPSQRNVLAVVKDYPFLVYLSVGTLFLFIFHNVLYGFMAQFIGAVGGSSDTLGQVLMFTALLELPGMFFFQRLLKLKSASFWLTLAGLFFVIRGILTVLASTVLSFALVQSLQGLGFAIFIPAISYVVNENMGEKDRTFGQTLVVVGMTTGGIIGNLLAGWLMDRFSVNLVLVVITISTLIGALAIFRGCQKTIK